MKLNWLRQGNTYLKSLFQLLKYYIKRRSITKEQNEHVEIYHGSSLNFETYRLLVNKKKENMGKLHWKIEIPTLFKFICLLSFLHNVKTSAYSKRKEKKKRGKVQSATNFLIANLRFYFPFKMHVKFFLIVIDQFVLYPRELQRSTTF